MSKPISDSKQVKTIGPVGTALFAIIFVMFFFASPLFLIVKLYINFSTYGIHQVSESKAIASECMYCGEKATVCLAAGKSGVLDVDDAKIAPSEYYFVNGHTYEHTSTGYIPRTDRYLVPDGKGWKIETEHSWEEKTYSDGRGSYTTVTGFYCNSHRDDGKRLIIKETICAYTLKSVSFWILVIGVSLPWILALIQKLRTATAEKKVALAKKTK